MYNRQGKQMIETGRKNQKVITNQSSPRKENGPQPFQKQAKKRKRVK